MVSYIRMTPLHNPILQMKRIILSSIARLRFREHQIFLTVTGPIQKRRGTTIELPIGKDGYHPAIVTPITGVTNDNVYTAEYFPELPSEDVTLHETAIAEVSNCEVWAIQKEDPTDAYQFHLAPLYEAPECLSPDDVCSVVVSRWSESALGWVSHGNGGSPLTAGGETTIQTSSPVVGASDFVRSSAMPDLFTFADLVIEGCNDCEISIDMEYCFANCEFSFSPVIELSAGTSVTSVIWDFGDGDDSTDMTPSHSYDDAGVYSISFTVYASNGTNDCSETYTFDVASPCESEALSIISADFNATTNNADLYLRDQSRGYHKTIATAWEWEVQIGDKTYFAQEQHPVFKNIPEGDIKVCLDVYGEKLGHISTDQSCKTITATAHHTVFTINPNPSSDGMFTLRFNGDDQNNYTYRIHDQLHRLRKEGQFNGSETQQINLTDFLPGVYQLTVLSPKGTPMIQKIVIGN